MAKFLGFAPEQTETEVNQPIPETRPGLFGRLGIAALEGLQSPLTAGQGIARYLTGTQLPPEPSPTEILQERLNIPAESLQPQSIVESYGQRLAQHGPLAALGGGLRGLLSAGIGAVPATAAQQAGYGPLAQDLVQLGTELGAGRFLPDKISLPFGQEIKGARSIPSLQQAKKIEDQFMRAAVSPTEKGRTDAIQAALNTVSDKLSLETDRKLTKNINHLLERVESNIASGEINPRKLIDLRSRINKTAQKLKPDEAALYIQPLKEGIKSFIDVHAAQNPKFFEHLTKRDQLTTLNNLHPFLSRFIEKIDLPKLPGGKIAENTLSFLAGNAERVVRGVLGNPAAREHYFDAVLGTLKNDPELVIKNLQPLARELNIEQKEQATPKPKLLGFAPAS